MGFFAHSYSWTNALPLLNRSFLIEEYDDATRNVEISKVVLVEADVDEHHIAAETGYLLALAERDPRIAGVVAGGRPEANDFARYLDEIAGHSKLKGIRRVLHTQPDELGESGSLLKIFGAWKNTGFLLIFACSIASFRLRSAW